MYPRGPDRRRWQACRIAAAALLVLCAGCASPAYRIKRNAELFQSFPAEAQALIREGRIDLGFDAAMVEMALGPPTDVYQTRNETGEATVWAYRDLTVEDPYPFYYPGSCLHGPGCRYPGCHAYPFAAVPVLRHRSAERLRVTFRAGQVAEIQTLNRSSAMD